VLSFQISAMQIIIDQKLIDLIRCTDTVKVHRHVNPFVRAQSLSELAAIAWGVSLTWRLADVLRQKAASLN